MNLLIVTQAVDRNDPILGFFHAWLLEFAKHTEHITVIALRVGEYDLPEHVAVVPLRAGTTSRARVALRFVNEAYMRRNSYDAVFVHMNPEYVLLGGPLWRVLGKKVSLWYTHKHVGFRLRLAELFVHRLFTASKESLRLASSKVRVMGHGIVMPQLPRRERQANAPIRVITIGRITRTKRIKELLAALEVLHNRHVDFTCSVVGVPITTEDETYRAGLVAELSSAPYAPHVQFVGPVRHEELPAVLARADVFVNLSLTGSLDKAVLEALAMKVAVVSSNEAFEELLRPEGLYLDSVTPEAIADAITVASTADVEGLGESVRRAHSLSMLIPAILDSLES